ncbi:hypothetical protein V5F44_17795 [Xanthobacter sp. V2C-8]|uniref:hypothetical protein n=1 Tax=Xanthobacter albus TaxID=3119929 RepID=UPI003727BFE4
MSPPLTSPALSLRRAIHMALCADAPLLLLLGGPRVHDVPPREAEFPFVARREGGRVRLDFARGHALAGKETP